MISGSDPDRVVLVGHGATSMTVSDQDHKVILKFPNPVEWAAFDPPVALQVAHQMIAAVEACGMKVTIQIPTPKIPENLRNRMVTRVGHILKTKRESAEGGKILATRLVDAVLNMVGM